jgi:hypothetical protein
MLDHQLRGGIQPTEKGWKKIAGVMKLFWFLECTTEPRPTTFDVSKWESVYTFLLRRVLIKLGLWS